MPSLLVNNARKCLQPMTKLKDYVVKDGMRFVKPYEKTHCAFARGRWIGKDLLSCYSHEFSIPESICVDMIESGRILVNEHRVKPSYIVQHCDRICVQDIFVEKPVVNFESVTVLENVVQMSEFWGIEKPAGIPVHAVSKFVKNSLHYILQAEYQITKPMRFAHRLDKCTSGVLILADSAESTRRYNEISAANQIMKCYLARVNGKFPDIIHQTTNVTPHVHHIRFPLICTNQRRGLWDPLLDSIESVENDSNIQLERHAYTQAIGVHYDECSDTSVVLCRPITGRTHQIRCHLKGMGYTIVNDKRIPEKPSTAVTWDTKYSIMKSYSPSIASEMLLEITMNEFFENRHNVEHEYRIDLHSCYYRSNDFEFATGNYPSWVTDYLPQKDVNNIIQSLIKHLN